MGNTLESAGAGETEDFFFLEIDTLFSPVW